MGTLLVGLFYAYEDVLQWKDSETIFPGPLVPSQA